MRLLLALILSLATLTARPNILFILTDDQGWPTLGSYGSEKAPTPQLDKLAAEGMRFTQAYVMPQCTPTRAALLSGQHTARNGMWHVIGWYGSPWARVTEPPFIEQFPTDAFTLPKGLRTAGYVTGMAGKWHLTNSSLGDYVSLAPDAGPEFGFDFVAPRGDGSHNDGDKWVDHLTAGAASFIRKNKGKPWFFYLSHHTIHNKVSAPPELVEKYLAAGAPATGMHNASYLAAIEHMDSSVGDLMAVLEETGQAEDTIVVFLSDNGGLDTNYELPDPPEDEGIPLEIAEQQFDNAPLRAGKGSPYEGGIRVPCIVRWPAGIKPASISETPVHVIDWLPTLLDAAGTSAPEQTSVDGVSLMPVFHGETLPARPLFWHLPLYDLRWAATPCAVIRKGDWKLIEYFGDSFDETARYHVGRKLELFNLSDDIGEREDLSAARPDLTESLSGDLHRWLGSIPTPLPGENPHFDKKRMFEETKTKQTWNQP